MAQDPPAGGPGGSRLGRIARLGGLTSRVSGSYLGQRLKGAFQDSETAQAALRTLHLENAERVVETMGSLKGAAMKVGQSLALAVDGMDLPPEVSGILGKLNDKAEPVPFPIIKAAVERELEAPLHQLFASFDPRPLGTASLAQAHAATLPGGRRVVVKVLHHGIEDSVDSDLAALKSILVAGRMLRRPKEEMDAIFEEIRERLHEELDYYREAANLEHFGRYLKVDGVEVPRAVPERSTGRVLTMDRVEGRNLDAFLADSSPEAQQAAGVRLVEAFHAMYYELRALHADPHGGNYLFRDDGTIGILDFGCVKTFSPWWVGDYARMARGLVDGDRALCLRGARAIEVLRSGDPEAEDALMALGQAICAPLQVDRFVAGAEDDRTLDNVKKALGPVLKRSDLQGPRDLVFLHRSLGGIYGMLRKLRCDHTYRATFLKYTSHAIAVAEGRARDKAPALG